MKLTPQVLTALTLPPGKADALFFDGEVPGLALRLRAGGTKGWIFQYRLGSKQRRLSLGSASAIPVHEARKLAAKLHAQVKLGQDPVGAKSEARARADETFGAVLPLFLARQKERLRPRAYAEVERHLKVHAKRLHALPLAGITRRDIAAILTATAARLSDASANRVRTSLSACFSWCIREGVLESNPAAWTERREETARNRVPSPDELREIWLALRDDAYGDVARLLILCCARREEIGALRWSEIDFEERLIRLPPNRTKNKRAHEIVLSAPAVAILRSRPRLAWPDGSPCDLVFGRGARGFADWVGSKADLDRRILAARQATAKKGAKVAPMPGWVLHDIRRLASTTMHERLSVQPHIVEAILGHVGHQAGTPGRYNWAAYRAEKAIAMTRWAEFVLSVVEGREAKSCRCAQHEDEIGPAGRCRTPGWPQPEPRSGSVAKAGKRRSRTTADEQPRSSGMVAKNDEQGAAAPTSSTPNAAPAAMPTAAPAAAPVTTPAAAPIATPAAAPVEEASPQPATQAAPATATQANEVPANEPPTIAVGASPEPASVADQIAAAHAAAEQASPPESLASLDPADHELEAVNLAVGPPDIGVSRRVHHFEAGGGPPRPPKLPGKQWVEVANDRRREQFIRDGTSITSAARELAEESKTAADCAKPLTAGYVKNELRQHWHRPKRERFKQQPK